MEIRAMLAPVFMMGVSGALVAGLAWGKTEPLAAPRSPAWPWVLLGGFAVLGLGLRGGLFHVHLLREAAAEKALGSLFGVLAAGLAAWATHLHQRSRLLLTRSPEDLDKAIVQSGAKQGVRVFEGRLGAVRPVTSPGGVVGAFYDAELRGLPVGTEKGPLISVERGFPGEVTLRGERSEASVGFAPELALAPVVIRRCQLGTALPGELGVALADGEPPRDALSYERVGKLGARCWVVGRLEQSSQGGWRIAGPGGAPALVALATEAPAAGRALAAKALHALAAAAGCALLAAGLLLPMN